jgi:fibronectin type 3 domain-containing protein
MKLKILIMTLVLTLVLASTSFGASKKAKGAVLVASDGKKNITLLWFVPVKYWPKGGWRILDKNNRVLVKKVMPTIDSGQKNSAKEFADQIGKAKKAKPKDQEMFNGLLAFSVLGSIQTAKSLGLAHTLDNVKPGNRIYKLQGLTSKGNPTKLILISKSVNSSKATPLPPAPKNFSAVAGLEGAKLYWSPVKGKLRFPVMSYKVERLSKGKAIVVNPLILKGGAWEKENPAYIDKMAPVERELTYFVRSVDALGRESKPSKVTFFMDDLVALKSPPGVKIKAKKGSVQISWQKAKSPNTRGFVVERSTKRFGLYEPLTPKALKSTALSYKDKTVIPGLSYYYQVRSMGERGDLGDPSTALRADVPGGTPPQPKGLEAEVNPILVSLTWKRSSNFPVAGYFVEKRAKGSKEWGRLQSGITPLNSFKDRFPYGAFGTYYYRVTAASYDHKKSKPSKEVKVVLPDLNPPGAPRITSVSGNNGKVTLTFEPCNPKEKTVFYKIIKDIPARKQGKIVVEDLSAKKTEFVDENVMPGQGYWYAIVGLDKDKKEGPWSERHMVKVISLEIPIAKKPKAKFIKTPFAHVRLEFKKPPENFRLAAQRQIQGEDFWYTFMEGITDTDFVVDSNPFDSDVLKYRIVYQNTNGAFGEPSEPVSVKR